MNKIYETEFVTAYWDATNKIIKTLWETPPIMAEDDYRKEITRYFEAIKEYLPAFSLINAQNAQYNVRPDTQTWMVENLFPIYVQIKLKKMAIIVSKDFITQLSLEQTIEEADNSIFQTSYFDNEDDALNWFID
jgi:hypothetical protein